MDEKLNTAGKVSQDLQTLQLDLEKRSAELAIINKIQEGLSCQMGMQAIYELVGEEIRKIFEVDSIIISSFNHINQSCGSNYLYEKGKRFFQEGSIPLNRLSSYLIKTKEVLLINEYGPEHEKKFGLMTVRGTEAPKSLVFVPLISGNEVNGFISLQDIEHANAFSPFDISLLTTVAGSLSVALENVHLFNESQRLLEETRQHAQELTIINSVQEGLVKRLDLQGIIDMIGKKISDIFKADTIQLVMYDVETDWSSNIYYVDCGLRTEFPDGPIFRPSLGAVIVDTLKPLHINNYSESEALGAVRVASKDEEVDKNESYLGVPILSEEKAIGLISVQSYQKNVFTKSDQRLLQTLANSMSMALENARLFDETQRLLKETEDRAAELSAVNTVSSALASELDVDALINLVGEQTRTIFNADVAYVALLDEDTKTIHFPFTIGDSLKTLPYGKGLTSKVLQTQKPLLLNDDNSRQALEIKGKIIGKRSMSYLGVPIMVSSKAVGVLSVQSTTHENRFNQDDVRLLTTIASHVSTALQNAQLFTEARQARADAEHANHTKSAFLANMSHELRTPLNAITGFTRIVKRKAEGVLPEKQSENLDKVLVSADHLLSLINTVLDIAKIEAGRMEVIPSNFQFNTFMELCCNTFQPLIKPTVVLEKKVGENITSIFSDQDKIRQIVFNLMSNAAKFTDQGRIVLTASRDEDNLRISVSDTGIGISPEALPQIFSEFRQADSSTTRQYGGTGLGLSISRNLAQLLGGDLTVESELSKGSTFTLVTPLQYKTPALSSEGSDLEPDPSPVFQEVPEEEIGTDPDQGKIKVLIIDDDPDSIYLVKESLDEQEFKVIGSRNGREGIRLARQNPPDAILLDILMRGEDGLHILHDLKEDPITTHIPVILLTVVDKKAMGYRLGAAAYLIKPVKPAVIAETIERLVGKGRKKQKHVLVVDDDPNFVDMLQQHLPEADFKIESALDGLLGLEAVISSRPDVILLDLVMPNLDGFGFIERLQADPQLFDLPIIVISSKELTKKEADQLKTSGAKIMKKQGFQGDKLMKEIDHALKHKRGNG